MNTLLFKFIQKFKFFKLLSCISFIGCIFHTNGIQAETTDEQELRGAFLINFARYSSQVAVKEGSADTDPFNLCLWKKNTLGDAFERFKEKKLSNRSIVPIIISTDKEIDLCSLLYSSEEFEDDVPHLQESIKGKSILLVTDLPGGGMVNFIKNDDQLTFECDTKEAAQSGIKFSAQLLKLAIQVR